MNNEIHVSNLNKYIIAILVMLFASPVFADELEFGTDDQSRVVEGNSIQFSLRLITDVAGCTAEGVLQKVDGAAQQSDDWEFVNGSNFNISETDSVMSFEILAIDDDEVEDDEDLVLDAILETTTCLEPLETSSLKTIIIEDNDTQSGGDPTNIEVVNGAGQMGSSEMPLDPITVRLTDDNGNPVSDSEVQVSVNPNDAGSFDCNGQVSASCSISTDANGEATISFTPASNESFSIEIDVVETGIATSVSVEGSGGGGAAGDPAGIEVISGSDQSGTNGQALEPIVLQVNDADGNPVSDQEVQVSVSPEQAGSFDCDGQASASCNISTNADGQVTVNFTPSSDEDFSLDINVVDTAVSSTLAIQGSGGGGAAGDPAGIEVVSGSGQMGSSGMSLEPITIRVTDADGNAVANKEVEFRVTPANAGGFACEGNGNNGQGQGNGGGKCGTVIITTDANGEATVSFTPDSNESFAIDIGVVETAITTSVSVEGIGGTAGIPDKVEVVSGSGQTGTNGQALDPIVLQINDAEGSPVSDREVQVSVSPEDAGSFDCDGQAAASCTLTSDAGGQVTVNFTPATDEDFSLDVAVPNTEVTTSLSIEGSGGGGGNAGEPAGVDVVSGSGQTGANGEALDPIVLQINDADGNPVSDAEVQVSVNPEDAGSFDCNVARARAAASCTLTSNADGQVTVNFTPATDDDFSLDVAVPNTEVTTSLSIEGSGGGGGNAGEPAGVDVVSGSGQTGTNGEALDPIVLQINDADGNPVSDAEVQVSVNPEDAGSFDCNVARARAAASCTLTSNADGQVTVNFTPATDEDFSLDIDVVDTAVSSSIAIEGNAGGGGGGGNAGEPAGVDVVSGSGQTGTNGQALDPIVLQINDAEGSPVSDREVQVSVSPEDAGSFECDGQKAASCTLTSDADGQVIVNFTPATDEDFSLDINVVDTMVSSSIAIEGNAGGGGGNAGEPAGVDVVSGSGQTGTNGQALEPIVLQINDAEGSPVSDREVQVSVSPEDAGSFDCDGQASASCTLTSNADGQVTVNFTPATDEDFGLDINVVDTAVSLSINVEGTGGAGGGTDVAESGAPGGGQGQSGGVGDTLEPISVITLQADGSPAVGVPVIFTVTPATGGTFENGESSIEVLTDENGEAAATVTLTTADGVQISAGVDGVAQPVLFDVAAEVVDINNLISIEAGDGQSGSTDTDLEALVVTVVNDQGEPVAGEVVNWEIIAGQAEFAEGGIAVASTTNDAGQASIDLTLLANEGAAIRATLASNDTAVTFSINALEPDEVGETVIGAGAGQTGGNGTVLDPIRIQAVQPNGEPAVNVEYLWTVRPQGSAEFENDEDSIVLTTDANGEVEAVIRLLTDARVVVTVQPVAGGDATLIVINGGIANIRGLSANEESLAEVLDDVCTDLFARDAAQGLTDVNEQDLRDTCNEIQFALDDETAAAAIERLTPSQVAAQGSASVRIASAMAGNIGARLMALRSSNDSSLNVAGLNFSYDGKSLPTGALAQSYIDGELKGGAAGDANLSSPWGMFVNGQVSFGDKSDSNNEAGFDFEIPSLTLGVDYRYSNEMVFGAALGYSTTSADFNNDAGNLDLEHLNLSLYGTYYTLNGFYLDGLAKVGFNNYQTNRNLSSIQIAQSDTDGNDFSLNISGGFNKSIGGTSYGAYARASYLQLDIDGYSETASNPSAAGAGSILMFGAQTIDSVIAVAGGTVSHAISTENAVIVPQLTLEWEHEFADDARQISGAFVYDPNSQFFEFSTDNPDRDYMNVGIGFSMITKGGKSGFLIYERKIDQTNIEQSTIKGGLRFEF